MGRETDARSTGGRRAGLRPRAGPPALLLGRFVVAVVFAAETAPAGERGEPPSTEPAAGQPDEPEAAGRPHEGGAAGRPDADAPDEDAAEQPAPQIGPTFRLATFNVLYKNVDLAAVVETLRAADADVIVLQETNAASTRAIRRALRGTFGHMRFQHAGGAGGLGVLCRAPLGPVQWIEAKHGPHGSQLIRLRLGGRDVQLLNVHLFPTLPRAGDDLEAMLARYARAERIRRREIEYLHGRLAKGVPAVVAGDLNCLGRLRGRVRRYLRAHGFTDSFASVHDRPDDHPTFHVRPDAAGTAGLRLDYLFHDAEFRTLRSRVIPSAGSDHSLVVSTLAWARPKPPGGGPVTCLDAGNQADRIAYVVDRREGMAGLLPAAAAGVRASVEALGEDQRFVVVPHPHPAEQPAPGRLAAATEAARRDAGRLLNALKPAGRADPLPALRRAIVALDRSGGTGRSLFFVSDGRFADAEALRAGLRALNLGPAVCIHTLLLHEGEPDEAAVATMRAIAARHGGAFRAVRVGPAPEAPEATPGGPARRALTEESEREPLDAPPAAR